MKPWVRWSVVLLLSVAILVAGMAGFGLWRGQAKRERMLALPAYPVALREDAASLERGRYLYLSRGCADCHGANGAGRIFIDNAKMGLRVGGPNISPGPGSVVVNYRAEDWERTLRHGVKPTGHALMVMPSEDYNRLTDDDVAAVVAYVRHLPPVRGGKAVLDLPPLLMVMYGFGMMQDAAEKIDHRLPASQPIAEAVTVAHGRYVSQMCLGCHGANLSGGKIPGAPPDWPAAANLTPGQGRALPAYADAQVFQAMLRTGKRPDGSAVSKVMPFQALAELNDVDAQALYLYLKSVPARDAGGR
jgi:mono/diheme cytochrome c family protein